MILKYLEILGIDQSYIKLMYDMGWKLYRKIKYNDGLFPIKTAYILYK